MAEGVVPIPDEAWRAAEKVVVGFAPKHEDLPGFVANAIEHAAPFIARAAVIQELREWVAEFEKASKDEEDAAKLPGTDDEGEIACRYLGAAYTNAADWLRDRVADLEGGA